MAGYIGARSQVLSSTTVGKVQDLTATDTTPEVTIINNTHEDTDGGREGKIIFKGQQSGGEESTLALIQAAHDGSSDDEKGLLSFKTNDGNDSNSPTERWRITSDGHFKAMVNGYGIDFSATEGSNTSSSVLDDYEEGTWTPAFKSEADANLTVGYNASFTKAVYTKIGNRVFCQCQIDVDSLSGEDSDNLVITGLPYTSGVYTSIGNGGGTFVYNSGWDNTPDTVLVLSSATQARCMKSNATLNSPTSDLTSSTYSTSAFNYEVQ